MNMLLHLPGSKGHEREGTALLKKLAAQTAIAVHHGEQRRVSQQFYGRVRVFRQHALIVGNTHTPESQRGGFQGNPRTG